MKSIDEQINEQEYKDYEKNPVESAKAEVKSVFEMHRDQLERDVEDFTEAIQNKFKNPLTEGYRQAREGMEQIIKESQASLDWIDGKKDDKETLLLVAARTDRMADSYLWFARNKFGGERILGEKADKITDQEKEAMGLAGKLTYSANVIRNSSE
ncbi:MAG TPA: hypothetical protein VLI92_03115 [Candidatus Saccharimonadales bacterium]|nr:hypothetical protein [Candidatus Saccharimonadales bacterium]